MVDPIGTMRVVDAIERAGFYLDLYEDGPNFLEMCCRPGPSPYSSSEVPFPLRRSEPEAGTDAALADPVAEAVADELLESLLDDAQLESYRDDHTFWVDTPRGMVRLGRKYDLRHVSLAGVERSLCVLPDTLEQLPDGDLWVTLLLWLTHDPDRFFRVALPGVDLREERAGRELEHRQPIRGDDRHDILSAELDRMQATALGTFTPRPGVETGLPGVDAVLDGVTPGHVVLVTGTPGSGKTALVLGMAIRTAMRVDCGADPDDPFREQVCLCTPRSSATETTRAAWAYIARVRCDDLLGTYLSESDWQRIADAVGRLVNLPIDIHSGHGAVGAVWPPPVDDHPTPLVVLDDAGAAGPDLARVLEDAHVLAHERGAVVVVAASVADPSLAALAPQVADRADVIMAIGGHRDHGRIRRRPADAVVVPVSVIKNRVGPTTTCRAVRVDGWRRFVPIHPV
ncbi:MAG: hypothetical protein K1X95_09785 [Acidimicrobiia bacterium]|nr:hypothetical protein [Acidimicrobiia bacterium]